MPKSRRRVPKKSGPGRRPTRTGRGPAEVGAELAELFDDLDARLAAGHPLALLELASSLVTEATPSARGPFAEPEQGARPPLAELLSVCVAAGPASCALAWAVAQLADDPLLRSRVKREAGARSVLWPAWLRQMDQVEAVGALRAIEPLREGGYVILHTRLAGFDLTAVATLDFFNGAAVADAFFSSEPLDVFASSWAELRPDGDPTVMEPLTPADARAWIEEGVTTSGLIWPPLESDSWPASRPLLTWLVRHLPEGGTGFVRPDWSDADGDALLDRFLADPAGAVFGSADDRSIVGDLLWYGTDYGYGDPRRWSRSAVEILLLDWYPRKIVADSAYLRRMPAVLRAWISFVHAEAGLGPELTDPTLAVVDALENDYRALVATPGRRQGAAALLGAAGLIEPLDLAQVRMDLVADHVGGRAALAALDDEPLPDEPFDWAGVPSEVHDRVAEVLALCEGCCDHFFGAEHRTAVRRLLHDAVLGRPRAFGGRGSVATAAAALCWLVARANDAAVYPQSVPTRPLMDFFGLTSSPSTRITTMRQAVGAEDCHAPGSLGSARYLVADQRRYLIAARDS